MALKPKTPASEFNSDPGVVLPDEKVVRLAPRLRPRSQDQQIAPQGDGDDPGPAAA